MVFFMTAGQPLLNALDKLKSDVALKNGSSEVPH